MNLSIKKNLPLDIKSYIYTIMFTATLLILLYIVFQVYPFGNHTFMYSDADQYYGFYGYLHNSFFSNDNLFYSWSNVLGNGMLSTYAYYAASPFNIFLIFFKNDLILGIHCIHFLKIIFIACCFCFYLNDITKEYTLIKSVFATYYAFIGYIIFYNWNASWFDGVALLPIMAVGLKWLLNGRNKQLYPIVLGVACYSNFYIGFMLCITSLLFYILFCVDIEKKDIWFNFFKLKNTIRKYIGTSLLGVGLSAVLLVPTILSLPSERKISFSELISSISYQFNMMDLGKMLYSGAAVIEDSSDNMPIIYVGIFSLVLIIIFFINKTIPAKRRIVAAILIAVIVFSFQIEIIDIIWHGMSINAWFNYRYSFVLSFIFIAIAFDSLINLPNERIIFIKAEAIFLLMTIIIFSIDRANLKSGFNMFDIVCSLISVLGLALILETKKNKKVVGQIFIIGILILSIMLNTIYVWKDCILFTSYKLYEDSKNTIYKVSKQFDSESIVRMETNERVSRSNACLYGYAGVTNYASTENLKTLQDVKKLGIAQSWMHANYSEHTPLSTDNLLGIEYYITKQKENVKELKLIDQLGDTYIYKNINAFPLFFEANRLINNSTNNYFQMQNEIFESISSKEKLPQIFDELDVVTDEIEYNDIKEIKIYINGNVGEHVYVQFPATTEGYLSIDNGNNYDIKVNEENVIYYIGKMNESGEIYISTNVDINFDIENIYVYSQNINNVNKYSHIIQGINSKKITSSKMKMATDSEKSIIITSTIPYDENWRVYQDGKQIQKTRNMNSFLAFTVEPGRHEIIITYIPKGFKIGLCITIISIILLTLISGKSKKKFLSTLQ